MSTYIDPNLERFLMNLLRQLRDDPALILTYANIANYINNIKFNQIFKVNFSTLKKKAKDNNTKIHPQTSKKSTI